MWDVLVYVRGILTGVGQLSTWVGSDNGDRCGVLQSESRYKQLAQLLKRWINLFIIYLTPMKYQVGFRAKT